jgi:two-component system phosphate regulon sensor histidine kinase PhoR
MRDVVAFASRRPGPDDETFRRLVVNHVVADLDYRPPEDQLRHLHKSYGEQSYLISYWQRHTDDRNYLVLAWHDVPRVVHDVLPALYQARDPKSRMNVVDENGGIIFGPVLSGGEFTVGRPFETTLYKWRVNVSLLSAEELAAGAARRRVLEMALVGLSGVVVIAGMSVVLVAAARERKLSALKSDFVANVSHELKTPLTVIGGFAETLRDRDLPPADRERFLATIESNAHRMQRIVDDLLDLSRYESGSWIPNVVSNDLAGVVSDVFVGVQRAADAKGLKLAFAAPPEAQHVEADPTALRQVLGNLVENAVRYTSRGGVTVRAEAPSNGGITLVVADTGSGIPAEHLGRIFERFYRVDPGRGRDEGGTGLGLAIVRHLVEAHGGAVRAESAVGRGTTISLHFPARVVTQA